MNGPCSVVDQNCDAPANLENVDRVRVGTCLACEEPVCKQCSLVIRRRGRVCHDCLIHEGSGRLVAERLAHDAGYEEPPAYLLAACEA